LVTQAVDGEKMEITENTDNLTYGHALRKPDNLWYSLIHVTYFEKMLVMIAVLEPSVTCPVRETPLVVLSNCVHVLAWCSACIVGLMQYTVMHDVCCYR
jgi:hypothetical protein